MNWKSEDDPITGKDARKGAAKAARREVWHEIEGDVAFSLLGTGFQFVWDVLLQGVSLASLPVNVARAIKLHGKDAPGMLSIFEKADAALRGRLDAEDYLKLKAQNAAKKRTIHAWEGLGGAAIGTGFTWYNINRDPIGTANSGLQQFAETQVMPRIPVVGLENWYTAHNPAVIDTLAITGLFLLSQVGRFLVQTEKVRNLSLRYYNASRGESVRPR